MRIGVRFCGGCNPRYDRGAFYKEVAESNSCHSFSIAEEGEKYDKLLVIGGCPACCAAYEQYDFDEVRKVWGETGKPDVPLL
ncbi:MAG: hypothetical protein ACI4LC_05690 [Emergencia sp.]